MKKLPYEFSDDLTKGQLIAGLVYLPVHMFLLPILIPYLGASLGAGEQNLLYYALSTVFVLAAFWKFLRAGFDTLVDRLGWCLVTILMALGLDYVLSYGVTIVMMLFPEMLTANPNNEAVMDVAEEAYGAMKAVSIFLAPIVEEVLFRGVVFGALRRKNRVAAYVLSILLFSVYHVWQYAVAYGDWTMLAYVIQYLPVSFALTWAYERSGSIWTPIGFHMLINAMSFYVLGAMESLM